MPNKLTRIVFFTCIAFLGIISLQIYWLYNSYQEKRQRLRSEISESMLDTKLSLIRERKTESLILVLRDTLGSLPKEVPAGSVVTLDDFQTQIINNLKSRNQQLPALTVITDNSNHLVSRNLTQDGFNKSWLKSDPKPIFFLNKENQIQEGKIQLVIEKVSSIIFHKILGIAIIAVFLMVFCTASLIYMIVLFIRQKKIADIRKDFTNNMTHELKTPISSATLALGILKEQDDLLTEDQRKDYFQIAENELKRLSLLVDKVLKIAAYEKGEINISRTFFLVKPWIASIVDPQRPLLSSKKAKISITVYPENLKFYGDKPTLSSVLQNLLDNAIKYADREKDYLYIQIDAWQSEVAYFFAVQDNGIGIPFYHQDRIFDKFFRVPTGDQHDTKGYGLGLSYVKEIVNLHGGNIELESTYHQGTRFKIIIPKVKNYE